MIQARSRSRFEAPRLATASEVAMPALCALNAGAPRALHNRQQPAQPIRPSTVRRWGTGSSGKGLGLLDRPRQELPVSGSGQAAVEWKGLHHVGLLIEDLERSLTFYLDVLGMTVRKGRPHKKLPYDGEWLSLGEEMIHLMVLPNPDPKVGRAEHGGRDRHFCINVASIAPIEARLKAAGWTYTASSSGRAALFFRDPDFNVLECAEMG